MARLEDITPGSRVSGLVSNVTVQISAVRWYGTAAIEITGKDDRGHQVNQMLFRADENTVDVIDNGLPWSFDIDANTMRLVSEAYRINLAHMPRSCMEFPVFLLEAMTISLLSFRK